MEADSHGFDPRIKEENAEMQKGGKLKFLTSSGWTNEKHMDYLSSVEQSFVDELNNKYCEEFLDWSHQKSKSTCNFTDGRLFHDGQFKMMKEGSLRVIKYGSSGKDKKSDKGRKTRNILLSDPWIRRWMSPCRGNNAGLIASGHRLEPESGLSEVSDQNFCDGEIGVVESNRTCSKKRARNTSGCN